MRKGVAILGLSFLYLVAVSAGERGVRLGAQTGTDRLNAPTADGSPTLKATSDWLAQALQDYGGSVESYYYSDIRFSNVNIDNGCSLRYTETETYANGSHGKTGGRTDTVLPLGAVTEIADSRPTEKSIFMRTGQIAAVHAVGFRGGDSDDVTIYIARAPSVRPGAEIPQDPYQMIPRIENALQHAVKLCQGTYRTPARSKDIF